MPRSGPGPAWLTDCRRHHRTAGGTGSATMIPWATPCHRAPPDRRDRMRAATWIGGLMGCLLVVGTAAAQTPGDSYIRVPTAGIRGGPSVVYPVTGYLRQGQPVHVVKDEGDFLAVTPP